jgi:uncharacterized membrane protein
MIWVFLIVLANFFGAASNIFDKILRTKYLRNSYALTACYGIFVLVFALLLGPFVINHPLPWKYAIAAFLGGTLVPYSTMLYFKAMSYEEASRVVPLSNFSAVFTLLLAAIFLGEKLPLLHYAAFFLILIGGILLTLKRSGLGFKISNSLKTMMLNSFIAGIALVISKFALNSGFFAKALFLFFLGAGLAELSLLAIKSVRREIYVAVKVYGKKFTRFVLLSNVSVGISQLFFYIGLKFGPVTLVSVLGSLTSVFVLIMAAYISIKHPLYIKENIDLKNISLKIFAISLMALGLILISF